MNNTAALISRIYRLLCLGFFFRQDCEKEAESVGGRDGG